MLAKKVAKTRNSVIHGSDPNLDNNPNEFWIHISAWVHLAENIGFFERRQSASKHVFQWNNGLWKEIVEV